MKLLAFDLEISRSFIDGEWRNKDLGISCIGLASFDGDEHDCWTVTDDAARHGDHAMKPIGIDTILITFQSYIERGYKLLSWNGLGFDFPMLYEYAEGQKELCKKLALAHYDLAFQMFCAKGFMIGLDTAARGMGLSGKLEGMSGKLAPVMWSGTEDLAQLAAIIDTGVIPGSPEAQETVLKYVQQDAVTTLEVIQKAAIYGPIVWTSRSGRRNTWYLPGSVPGDRLRNVAWCLQEPEPDTSWMSEPRTRNEYAGWLT